MEKVCFKTDDGLLFDTLKKALSDLGAFDVVRSGGMLALEDKGDRVVLGGGRVLKKPFAVSSLVDALENEVVFVFAEFAVYPVIRKVVSGDRFVVLTEIESKLLELLCRAKRGIASGDMMQKIFGCKSASAAKSLSTHLHNLRKKLSRLGVKDDLIIIAKNKYRLNF